VYVKEGKENLLEVRLEAREKLMGKLPVGPHPQNMITHHWEFRAVLYP